MTTDTVEDGLLKLDQKWLKQNPPRISWGDKFSDWEVDKQIRYLKRLASTMNHAAFLLQNDLRSCNKLLVQKEARITQMTKDLAANNVMLQQMAASLNDERQKSNAHAASLNKEMKALRAKVQELEDGNNN